MKIIIAGSRSITQPKIVDDAIQQSGWVNEITEVVSGCALGPDKFGEMWARRNKIPVKRFPALWYKYGKEAGHYRNKQMAEYADKLIAVWDGKSTGTHNMLIQMKMAEKPVYLHKVEPIATKINNEIIKATTKDYN